MKSHSRTYRRKLGLTKVEVAAIAGIGMGPLERVDRGDPHVRMDTLFRVALALGASPVQLWPALSATPKAARATFTRYTASRHHKKRPPQAAIQQLVRDINAGRE